MLRAILASVIIPRVIKSSACSLSIITLLVVMHNAIIFSVLMLNDNIFSVVIWIGIIFSVVML